ncbi:sigma-70 family RNA polymerase sigma factor [Microbulbifer thermotolerans]|uniref:sigma-70 family RNA polymerase sigma factor n=1 Tax=Microbulbifer thermotolerans TaxID=252514 RepID=UPI00224A79DF|nr:sigma-70 family RNA polymerase sigma factor [Microbulbifer thermotolerans]MCX2780018.1 sigma-70 family RNA polymerase sigma factor [Microbulbifer thermotolerans]MCX2805441.1 sigma-70 family RNA polymerase sigma factor [Microbulbifer thermotolerans]
MSRDNFYSRDEAWLKDADPPPPEASPLDDNAIEDLSKAPLVEDNGTEGGSSPMQNYLKHLYRLQLLTPEEEQCTTSLLRELEDKLIALLQKRGVELVALRSEGVEQRGSTGAYDHGLIIAHAEELLASERLSKRDRNSLRNLLRRFREQRQKLIQCNLRLVIAIAKRFRNPSIPFIDLIQEGNVGLMKAIERFKPQMGYRFSTYAYWWIQQEIQLALRRNDDLVRQPANVQDDLRAIYRAIADVHAQGLPASDENLARQSGLDLERVQALLKLPGPTGSLDEPLAEDQSSTRLDYAPADELYNTDEQVTNQELAERLREAVARLPMRQRTVLYLRYGLISDHDCSFRVIGEQLGLSQERARQLHADALRQLKRQWR